MREKNSGFVFGLKRERLCLVFALLFTMVTSACATSAWDWQSPVPDRDQTVIRERLLQGIYDEVPREARGTWLAKEIEQWKTTIRPDGSYSDVDYVSTDKPGWGLLDNLGRALVYVMAARLEGHPHYRDPEMDRLALRSIHFAASRDWDHVNWWHKEIGLPLRTYKLLLLFADKMPEKDRAYVMALTRKAHLIDHPSHWAARGQNLIWYSHLTIALGVLFHRSDWFKLSADALTKEIGFDHEQGIKEDYSFFQHGSVYYSGGYGLAFASDAARLMLLLQGTAYALTKKTYDTLAGYVLDGELWIAHRKVIDHSSSGRYYCRFGGGDSKALQPACEYLSQIPGARQVEFKHCAQTLKDGSEPGHQGNKMFWIADFMTHNRPKFGISVRMFSRRTLNGDTSPLGEGLKSHHLSDGLTYFYRTGEEYWDIFGIWDFKRLPGTTEEHLAVYPPVANNDYWPDWGVTDFVGGVSDGVKGASTMDFKQGDLSAKKSWFFHETGMVALGAAITCKSCQNVVTSINQEWAKTDMNQGHDVVGHQRWVHANGMGYLIPDSAKLVAQNAIQEGSWKSIDINKNPEIVRGNVTSLWIEHGAKVTNGSYAYSVYPEMSEEHLHHLAKAPDYQIISNSAATQAVLFPKEKLAQFVFHQSGIQKWDHASWISVDQNVVVQLQEVNDHLVLSVAAPAQNVTRVKIDWNWKHHHGSSVIQFKAKPYAGETVIRFLD